MPLKENVTNMDSSALNVAHQLHRRAEGHLRCRRYDDAIQCHQKAADKLEEAMKLTRVPRSLESLHLQQDYHIRQQEIIKLKKVQFEMYRKALENQHQKIAHVSGKPDHLTFGTKEAETSSLQIAIYRNVEEADSLLELLVRRSTDSEVDSLESMDQEVLSAVVEGRKHPKDDRMVIEELRTLNAQLRTLVIQLVVQLDACQGEAERLRDRIRVLEAEAGHTEQEEQVEAAVPKRKTSLHVITDSTGGNSSPFVFSPCGELSPDVVETHVTRELPVLAPLEMPNFDFSVFMKKPPEGDQ
ncbi:nuclear receptor-binding factor 2 isoform X2 [Anabrus simplex]|uniref:nuclear receptor-binding factor 2 isoform X2 n=1 Tax=Anabrus simplex TaxID=316456 RepID=UPI0035A36FCA